MSILWPHNHLFVPPCMCLSGCLNEWAPPPASVPWSAIQNSSLYGSDGHGNNVTMFPVSSIHLKVFMTNVYSSLSLHSSPLSNWWFPSRFVFKLYSFISYSPLPTTYFSAFPSIPTTHTHIHTNNPTLSVCECHSCPSCDQSHDNGHKLHSLYYSHGPN